MIQTRSRAARRKPSTAGVITEHGQKSGLLESLIIGLPASEEHQALNGERNKAMIKGKEVAKAGCNVKSVATAAGTNAGTSSK